MSINTLTLYFIPMILHYSYLLCSEKRWFYHAFITSSIEIGSLIAFSLEKTIKFGVLYRLYKIPTKIVIIVSQQIVIYNITRIFLIFQRGLIQRK